MKTIPFIINLFETSGDLRYQGERITQLEHAWQCGMQAKKNHAPKELQLAAWLHDIGHLLSKFEGTPTLFGIDDRHELVGSQFLSKIFNKSVTEPIALHVLAKRYLVSTDESYKKTLSKDSVRSLQLQGGLMSTAECDQFQQMPEAGNAIVLRRWDDIGKSESIKLANKNAVLNDMQALAYDCLQNNND